MNQFGAIEEKSYNIDLTKAEYKLFRRLRSIDHSCEIHISLGDKGQIKSCRKIDAKEEVLDTEEY